MNKYKSYKDSEVKWINEIPFTWNKSRLRMIGDLYGGLSGKEGGDFNDEENLSNKPFIPYTNIFNRTYISKDHFQLVNVEGNENQNRVLKNDIFFLMSSESYEDLGKCSILLNEVDELYLNSFCKGYRIKDKSVYPPFLNYQLLGSLHKEMISIEGNGFTRINLRQGKLLDIPVFIPPLLEQQQIVSFLDTKTSLIDSLINKTQKKIELLKEKSTSLINEGVTKGLNPNINMKESGVDWIGLIPSHWKVCPLFSICEHVKEKNTDNEETVLTLSYGKLKVRDLDKNFGLLPDNFNNYQRIRPSYIVLRLMDLQNDKRSLRVSHSYLNGIITPVYVSLKCNKKMISEFLYFFLHNSDIKKVLYSLGGGLRQTLRFQELKRLNVVLPSLKEQEDIVKEIKSKIEIIEISISKEQRRVKLLKEYKQSLISEVVIGKRRVVT